MKRRILLAVLLAAILTIGTVLPAAAAELAGGWQINTKVGSYLTAGEKKVFDKAVMNYSLGWNGNLAGIETIWSVTGMGLGEGKFAPMVSLGQRTEAGPFSIGLDVFYIDTTDSILDGVTVMPSATWSISDRFEFFAKCGYEKRTLSRFDDNFFVGGVLNCYPLQESQALRLHAAVSYYKDWATTCVNLGATWRFEFALGK